MHVKKLFHTNGTLRETTIYISKSFVRVINQSGTYNFAYIYQDGVLVAQVNPDGSKYFIHGDAEGSSSVVTNSSGNILENTSYSPYGQIISGGNVSRYDYTGQEFDSAIGDYDYNFRKYKAEWGLFTQPDTLIQNVYDPQSLNRYMFERANPYNRIDPSGHNALIGVGILILLLGIVSAGYEIYMQVSITKRIYSWSRIGNSFIGGIWGGILEGAGVMAELSGHPVGILAGLAVQAYGLYQINEQYLDAKKAAETQKAKDESDIDVLKESKPTPEITPTTPNVQTDASRTVSANAQVYANNGNTNQNTYDLAYKYSKYSSSQPNKKVDISNTGTATLGYGGSYGNFKCFASSCSASKAYKKSSK